MPGPGTFTNNSDMNFFVVGYRSDKINQNIIGVLPPGPTKGESLAGENIGKGLEGQELLRANSSGYEVVINTALDNSFSAQNMEMFYSKSGQLLGKRTMILAFFPSVANFPPQLDVIQEVEGSSGGGSFGITIAGFGVSGGGSGGETHTNVFSAPQFAFLVEEGFNYSMSDDSTKPPGHLIVDYRPT